MNNFGKAMTNFFVSRPISYLQKVLAGARVIWAFLIAAAEYVLFPDRALLVSLLAVLSAALLDIVTRYLATRHQDRKKWNSEKFWAGTGVKLVAYLVIAILAGLSYRLAPFLQQPTVYLWSVAYLVMFLREAQSNLENLADMGADVGWLRSWAKRQERKVLGEKEDPIAPKDE